MKHITLIYTLLILNVINSFSQNTGTPTSVDDPSVAPHGSIFSAGSNLTGALTNSVNLFSGEVNLPLPLVSLPGINGIGASVSIMYSSAGVPDVAKTWNVEAPTGIVGLGWSMAIPKIIVDHKNTGTREDDEFYLVEGGPNKLFKIGVDATSGHALFATKNYQPWKILYDSTNEKWIIIKEDGNTFVYGDKNSNRYTVQYMIRWGNWIGNSSYSSGQSLLATEWNLSSVNDRWGNMTKYTYTTVERFVKNGSGNRHTEASYLKQIEDPAGKKIVFHYLNKTTAEFQQPHTEVFEDVVNEGASSSNGDAYQERYETRYLDKITVLKEGNALFQSLQFSYTLLGTGDLTKRLLTSIISKNATGLSLPGISFTYLLSGVNIGRLSQVKSPEGATVTYNYETTGLSIPKSNRQLTITAPSGYKEPNVYFGHDYVVVIWRQLASDGSHQTSERAVCIRVYQWDGEWIKNPNDIYLQYIKSDDYGNLEEFQVYIEDDYFAIYTKNYYSTTNPVLLFHKDELKRGSWTYYRTIVETNGHWRNPVAGKNFFAVGSRVGKLTIFTWGGQANEASSGWVESNLTLPTGDYYYGGTNNYILSYDQDPNPDKLFFYSHNPEGLWSGKQVTNSFNVGDHEINWYCENSFAVMVPNANDYREQIYQWDPTYTTFTRSDIIGNYGGKPMVYTMNNSHIYMLEDNKGAVCVRYDGQSWKSSGHLNAYGNYYRSYSFGEDFCIRSKDDRENPMINYLKIFNPNSLSWQPDISYSKYKSSIFGSIHGGNPLKTGRDIFSLVEHYYYRNFNGTWNIGSTLKVNSGDIIRASGFVLGGKFALYQYDKSAEKGFYYQPIKNNKISNEYFRYSGKNYYARNTSYLSSKGLILVGPNTLVTYTGSDVDFLNKSTLYLQRISNNNIEGTIKTYPVKSITINHGSGTVNTSFDYHTNSALADLSGTSARYNKVTVVQGSLNPATKPYGYTEYYFHNGLTSTELSAAGSFPPPNLDSQTNDLPTFAAGTPYRTIQYSATGKVAESSTAYSVLEKRFFRSGQKQIEVGFYLRQKIMLETVDNISKETEIQYNNGTGFPSNILTKNYDGKNNTYHVINKYWWEVYDPTKSKNILSPVILETNKHNTQTLSVNVVKWKGWPTTDAPHKTYIWKGNSNENDPNINSWWNTEPNSAHWLLQNEVVKIDEKGNVLNTVGRDIVHQSIVYGYLNTMPIATINNASSNMVFFDNFEAKTGWDGNMTAYETIKTKTGSVSGRIDKSTSGEKVCHSTKWLSISLTQPKRYRYSGWIYSSGPSADIYLFMKKAGETGYFTHVDFVSTNKVNQWVYVEKEFDVPANITQLNIRLDNNGGGSVWFDDIRLYPANARMSTMTYEPLVGKTSETDDSGNTIYYEYDEFNRLKLVREKNSNIVKMYQNHIVGE